MWVSHKGCCPYFNSLYYAAELLQLLHCYQKITATSPPLPPLALVAMPGSQQLSAARLSTALTACWGSKGWGLVEIPWSRAPWPTWPCHRAAQTLAGRVAASPGPCGEQLFHCFPDTLATGGGSKSFCFCKKLHQQKMDLFLEGAHLAGCAWSVEPFPQ